MTPLIMDDTAKLEAERVAFNAALAVAMDAMSAAARAVHDARLLSPTGLELELLRRVAADATDLVANLHVIASSEALSA